MEKRKSRRFGVNTDTRGYVIKLHDPGQSSLCQRESSFFPMNVITFSVIREVVQVARPLIRCQPSQVHTPRQVIVIRKRTATL